jgi:hypothetical protein
VLRREAVPVKTLNCPQCRHFVCEIAASPESSVRVRLNCRHCRARLYLLLKDRKLALVLDPEQNRGRK